MDQLCFDFVLARFDAVSFFQNETIFLCNTVPLHASSSPTQFLDLSENANNLGIHANGSKSRVQLKGRLE